MESERVVLFVAVLIAGLFTLTAGDCIWYGECGHQKDDPFKKLNCPYNGPPKPFNNVTAKKMYSDLCPDLYKDSGYETCCSDEQLITLASNLQVPQAALQRCPSCYYNFMNIWCYLTCSPNQADFMKVSETRPFRLKNGTDVTVITAVDVVTADKTINAMFNSCKNVQNPSTNTPALDILCGTPAVKCTPQGWLDYMGNVNDGQSPFDIYFHMEKSNLTINGTVLTPLEYKTYLCNATPPAASEPCMCDDCPSSPCGPQLWNETKYSWPFYRIVQLNVSRPANKTIIQYKKRNFTNIFDKDFLHKLLTLQDAITEIKADYMGKTITLQDICFAPLSPDHKNCTIHSILNYYQNSHYMIDKIVKDRYGWLVLANYLDHYGYCIKEPEALSDTTMLHTPCVGTFGGPVYPWLIHNAVKDYKYWTANEFVITFLVKRYVEHCKNKPVQAWQMKFLEFMHIYSKKHPDIHFSFYTEM